MRSKRRARLVFAARGRLRHCKECGYRRQREGTLPQASGVRVVNAEKLEYDTRMNAPIHLFAPEVLRDPYPLYRELRRLGTCQVEPGGIWAIARHDDVKYALHHPELFSSAGFSALLRPDWLPRNPVADSLLTQDPPRHTKSRGLLGRGFTPRAIERLTETITRIANQVADDLTHKESCEFLSEFASPVPARVIGEVLGLDPDLHTSFRRWTDDITAISPVRPSDERIASIQRTLSEMEQCLRQVITERRQAPRDDVVSELVQAELEGESLTDEEILSFLFILLPAGFETTANLLANTMLGFLERPHEVQELRSNPDQIPAYLEETLRYDGPTPAVVRLTTREVELGGTTIPGGAMTLILLGSANRDPACCDDPEVFRPARNAPHLTFSHGIHYCLGASLARREARIALEALLSRFRGFEAMAGELTYLPRLTVRGPAALGVRLIPA